MNCTQLDSFSLIIFIGYYLLINVSKIYFVKSTRLILDKPYFELKFVSE